MFHEFREWTKSWKYNKEEIIREIGEIGHYGILVFGHCLRYINKRNLNHNLLRHFQVVNPREHIPGKCYEQPSARL